MWFYFVMILCTNVLVLVECDRLVGMKKNWLVRFGLVCYFFILGVIEWVYVVIWLLELRNECTMLVFSLWLLFVMITMWLFACSMSCCLVI